MNTKEQKAKQYAELNAKHIGGNKILLQGVFYDGYTTAEKDSDQNMIAFAEWHHRALIQNSLNNKTAKTSDLLDLFKETQNK